MTTKNKCPKWVDNVMSEVGERVPPDVYKWLYKNIFYTFISNDDYAMTENVIGHKVCIVVHTSELGKLSIIQRVGVIAHEIAHAYHIGHNGLNPDIKKEERLADELAISWGFEKEIDSLKAL